MLSTLERMLERESKRAIFTHGSVEDWFCAACNAGLDIDSLPPQLVVVKINDRKLFHRVLCMPCIDARGGVDALVKRLTGAYFEGNPTRVNGALVPSDDQTMIDGTRPDPSTVDIVTVIIH